jgi:polysaccharide export outer membrane protein
MTLHRCLRLRAVSLLALLLAAGAGTALGQPELPDAPPPSSPAALPPADLGGPAPDSLPPDPPPVATPGTPVVPPDYKLGPEDVVEISVWREDTLKGSYLVRPDGYVSFPLAGEILAEGRTASEIRADITDKLKKFLSDPVVSVTVVRVSAQKIYVIGRVAKPGEFVSGRYIDVLQALSMAGGLTPFATPNDIRIMRKLPGGTQQVIPFRYNDVVKGKNLEQNIILKPGDVVVVP